jgi:hypothetical protein
VERAGLKLVFKIVLVILALIFIALATLVYFGPMGPASPYKRFHNRNPDYYSKLAEACDSILLQHPNFTRHSETSGKQGNHTSMRMLWMDASDVLWDRTRLSPSDPSLPDIIRALHPGEILLAPGQVFIGFGVSRLGWAIIWEQDDLQTNKWTLKSNGDGYERTVYVETKLIITPIKN